MGLLLLLVGVRVRGLSKGRNSVMENTVSVLIPCKSFTVRISRKCNLSFGIQLLLFTAGVFPVHVKTDACTFSSRGTVLSSVFALVSQLHVPSQSESRACVALLPFSVPGLS